MTTQTQRFEEDTRRDEARRLRVDPGLSRAQLMRRFGVGNGTLTKWLAGLEPPSWTKRPNAKDDLRERALTLRRDGWSVPRIAAELAVSKSTAFLWTRDIPLDGTPEEERERLRLHMEQMRRSRWVPANRARDERRANIGEERRGWVGQLSEREVLLMGAVAYWCEGQKAKAWKPNRCRMMYINSDPDLIRLFLRYVEILGEDRRELTYRIHIHETADVREAECWWADQMGVPVDGFLRATVKTHNPSTVRHNVGDSYRGCLAVVVPQSRELYWRTEGLMRGLPMPRLARKQVRCSARR